jgi:hypothetical protein
LSVVATASGRRVVGLTALGIVIGTVAMRIPSLAEPGWYFDDGAFTAVAWAMSKGQRLYAGVYDDQPPGIYWLYRLLLALGAGEQHIVVQVAATIAVVATAVLVFEIARRWLPLRHAALAGALTGLALSLPTLDGDFLNVEVAALPFFMAALLIAFNPRAAAMLVSGALLGVAVAIRPSFAVDGLALLVPLLSVGHRMPRLLLAAAGLALAGAIAFTALWLQGSLAAYLTIVVPSDHLYALAANGGSFTPLLVRLAVLGAIGAIGVARSGSVPGRLVAVWLPASVAGASLTPLEFTHFAQEAIPAIAFSIAYAVSLLRWRWVIAPAAALAVVVGAELVLILPAQQTALMQSKTPPRPFLHEVGYHNLPAYYANWLVYVSRAKSAGQYAEYFGDQDRQRAEVALLKRLAPAGTARLIVLGSRPWLYVESGMLPATPYVATCARSCIVASEPADIGHSLDAACADLVVAVGQVDDWRPDLALGGYVEVPGAPWPTFQRSRPGSCP